MITKPIEQITAADISELCCNGGAYESQTLEFKRELPNRDGQPDAWLSGRSFSNYARDHLFRELVAFANASGGTLILGVEESEDVPPRAAKIVPLPRVHDLASRLEEAARACVEPPLPSLFARGIKIGTGDEGVVALRTVSSPFGPHRVVGDGHAYIRRGTSSVKMTMREIQDLTLGRDLLDCAGDRSAWPGLKTTS
jgi:predicted HTH transcriptional regulator